MEILKGIGVSGGIGIGHAVVLQQASTADIKKEPSRGAKKEQASLDAAVLAFSEETEALAERLSARGQEAEILRGHVLMLRDPFMMSGIRERIKRGESAAAAVAGTCETYIGIFESASDELTRQRAADVRDIERRLLAILQGEKAVDLTALPAGTVLVVEELTPSQAAALDSGRISGIIAACGGMTSHAAILARAACLPAVLGLKNATTVIKNDTLVALDGEQGTVFVAPGEATVKSLGAAQEALAREREQLRELIGAGTRTADGVKKEVFANIGSAGEVDAVLAHDAEGVGLFRTEFLFMDRPTAPDEEAQYVAYREAVMHLKGKPLVLRTLDVGGDKPISYLPEQREQNPFLGVRGIRHSLGHWELFGVQLRAMLRASAHGDLRILLPMITCIEELRAARECLEEARQELASRGEKFDAATPLGVMIETPAACLIAELLAAEADFFSIGTNDLVQYVMAVDRGNEQVAHLYHAYQPAVLRALERVIGAAKRAKISVSMCGEAAADPLMTPLLLAFGLDEFSVSPPAVLKTRAEIGAWRLDAARVVANEALRLCTAEEVHACLQRAREARRKDLSPAGDAAP